MRVLLILILVWQLPTAVANDWDYDFAFRLRHQQVNDQWLKDATADTLLARATIHWQIDDEWQLLGQYDQVLALDKDDYNSVTYWNEHSPIPDPPGGELNQLHINWQLSANWQARLGRQQLSFNNERHVGGASYWQNEQTFDALSLIYQDGLGLNIHYSYLDKVHRIFGDDSNQRLPPSDDRYKYVWLRPLNQLGIHQHQSHLININYQISPNIALTSFAYLIDNLTQPLWSSDTFGIRVEGSAKPEKIKFNYNLEIARQQAGNNHPVHYQTWYFASEIGIQYQSHRFDLGYEYLGEDNQQGFNTSLATNHKFLGWADIFTRYNLANDINDKYLSYAGRNGKIRWNLVAHRFDNNSEHLVIGNELDLELAWRYNRKLELKLLAAKYQAKEGSPVALAANYDLSTWMVAITYNL